MKTICFYFQIHQPYRLKRYRFFNIGRDHYYYDDYSNEDIMQQIAARSFIPANRMLLDLINTYKGKFKFAISVSGVALDQMEVYAPEVIDGLKELSRTGAVEFLAETYSHSLSSLIDPVEFQSQVQQQTQKIKLLFDQKPKVLRNTEMIFSDDIAEMAYNMGYTKMVSEGAKLILSWRSPNYVYKSENQPNMKLLLRNSQFSDDISLRFSDYTWKEYPLTAEKYISWIAATSPQEEVFNIFMNYETFGNLQPAHSGIFEFMKALPKFAFDKGIEFSTPSQIMDTHKPVGTVSVPLAISWSDEERDLSRWLGNKLQKSAFNTLYEISERIRLANDRRLKKDWQYLQSSDHFYYMSTKHFYDGSMH
ncbi:MAG TPA: alpha-amylase, partial [Porphyromonadaceae bacterium]|nr:alpha-amylase [Porphyromonadaceae bacterium]